MSDSDWRSDTDTIESPISQGHTGPTALFELFGDAPGRVVEIKHDRTFFGRDTASMTGSSVRVPHPSVSRQHAVIVRGRYGLAVRDLGSTNGTFVNGHKIDSHNLCHGDRIKFGRTLFKVLVDPDLEGVVEAERRRLDRIDPLTQVLNRATLLQEIQFRLQARRTTVVVATVNDYDGLTRRFPGVAMDHLLSGVGDVLGKRIGPDQTLGRVGQASFAVLMGDADLDDARRTATSLSRHVAATSFTLDGAMIPVTLAFGCAQGRPGQTPEGVLAAAVEELPRQLIALD